MCDDIDDAITAAFHEGNIPPITDGMERIIVALVRQWQDGGDHGNLHIIVADQNLEDEHIAFCRQWCADRPDDRHDLDIETLDALASADYPTRVWAYLIADWVDTNGIEFTPDMVHPTLGI